MVSAVFVGTMSGREPPPRYDPNGALPSIHGIRLGMDLDELVEILGPPLFGPPSPRFAISEHQRVEPMMRDGRTSWVFGPSVEQSALTLVRVGDSARRVKEVFQGRCYQSGADNRWQYTLRCPGSVVLFLGHRSHRVEGCTLQ